MSRRILKAEIYPAHQISDDFSSARDSRANDPRCVSIKCLDGASMPLHDEVPKIVTSAEAVLGQPVVTRPLTDRLVLYHTLVADGCIPPGYEVEFCSLGPSPESVARRQNNRVAPVTNVTASGLLREHHPEKKRQAKETKTSADQFLLAAETAPRRFKSRLQRSSSTGPTARKDAEEKERSRWVEVLAAVLVRTPTPMGKLLADRLGSVQFLGAGRRAFHAPLSGPCGPQVPQLARPPP